VARARSPFRTGRILAIVVLVLLGLALLALRERLFAGNLHEVVPGEIHRSAQLDAEALLRAVDELGLRSVVNLRGAVPEDAWWREEHALLEAHGVTLHDLRMSGTRLPSRQELRALLALLERAERPTLVHCLDGTDRSGVAASLALLLGGEDLRRAREEFALRHGHLGRLHGSDAGEWLDLYAAWLAREGLASSPDAVRRFVRKGYVPYFYDASIEPLAFTSAVPLGREQRLELRVTNRSPRPWRFTPAGEVGGVHLGLRLARVDGPLALELRGTTPDAELAPGASLALTAEIPPLAEAGAYRLHVDLVDEGVVWFAEMGSRPLELAFVVATPALAMPGPVGSGG
jgi:protein tyrosine phosphatase (PTP) superfamily phosphohydrolase (DUF442 family)